ncbi:hypothetical protein BX616_004917, partial [Lobosporangium transversale]
EGDIGRIERVLSSITIMFQAKGTKNYGKELLKLTYGIRRLWAPKVKRAVMRSWLVNTSGRNDGWIPTDMFQEHTNRLIKSVHAATGSNMSWNYLAKSISMNAHLFAEVDTRIDSEFDLSFDSYFHSEVSKESDIVLVINEIRRLGILEHQSPQGIISGIQPVRNLFIEGMLKLISGGANRLNDEGADDENVEDESL